MRDEFTKPHIEIIELDRDIMLASGGSENHDVGECEPVACNPKEDPPPPIQP